MDLWQYIAPIVAPGNLNGRPVGVTQTPGGDAIHQAQFDAPNSRRVCHTKGTHGVPADWEELYLDGDYVGRAIDTSRPAKDGGPYTLHDTLNGRGSRWAKRYMAVGDVFERNPYVSPFNMQTGVRGTAGGPHRTWLKLAQVHTKWRGVDDVIELWWLTNSPTQTSAEERYFYGKGLGLVGFEGPGLKTYPNFVWDKLPPAANVPVLTRKAISFPLPPLPDTVTPPPAPADGFYLLNPAHSFRYFIWDNYGERDTPESGDGSAREFHPAVDITFATGEPPPYPIVAAHPARVTKAGWDTTGYGNLVVIKDDVGRETRYAHLESLDTAMLVGATVERGQRLGNMGYTGRVVPQGEGGRHLHFEFRLNGVAQDPRPLMRDTIAEPPPVTPPVTPEPELPPPFEVVFSSVQEKDAVADIAIQIFQRIKAHPGRRVYITVRTE